MAERGPGRPEKNRRSLTVYLPEDLLERFRQDAKNSVRPYSDQMVVILTEHYARRDSEEAVEEKPG